MTTSKKAVSRSAKSTSRTIRIRLSQVRLNKDEDYCHRLGEALNADNLASLADNLVAEGQQTPMTVHDSGQKDGTESPVYILIGGFRRYHALQKAIKQNLDTARIHQHMEIDAVEVVRGEDQSEDEYRKDLLIRSVAENEQRRSFTMAEKLEIVKGFKTAKVPDPRAASALAISDTQYRRFVSVTEQEWLHKYVVQNCIGMSDAAELIQAAVKKGRVKEFEEDLDKWVAKHRALIEQEREELAKVGKKLSGSAEHVKKYAITKLVKHWMKCIEAGRRFDDNVGFRFGIRVDSGKGTILIPSAQLKITELSAADFETMIGELEYTVEQFVPLMRQRRLVEQSTEVSPEEMEMERGRIRSLRREREEQKAAAEAGRPAADFAQVKAPELQVIDADDEADEESESPPAEEVEDEQLDVGDDADAEATPAEEEE